MGSLKFVHNKVLRGTLFRKSIRPKVQCGNERTEHGRTSGDQLTNCYWSDDPALIAETTAGNQPVAWSVDITSYQTLGEI